MGRHGGRTPKPGSNDDRSELAKLVDPDSGWPEEYPEDRPTNEDLWAHDKFYDPLDDKGNRIRVIGAVALCLVLTGAIGSVGWMFGTGHAEDNRAVATKTIDHPVVTETATQRVTLNGQSKTVLKTVTQAAPVTVTTTVNPIFTTFLKPTVPVLTTTPKPLVSIKTLKITLPPVTETIERCFGRWRDGATDEIECP